MRIGKLEVVFHRTVRVADGRVPSNLPPSLGTMKAYKVADYRDRCPKEWDEGAFFVALHDTEALWISFRHNSGEGHIGQRCQSVSHNLYQSRPLFLI